MNKDLELALPKISFDSDLAELIIKLEILRNKQVLLNIHPILFQQVKNIFYMYESLLSARIEGNRTTISNYITTKFIHKDKETENIQEIINIEKALDYVNERYNEDENFKLSSRFLRELHNIVTNNLKIEGSQERGTFRHSNVIIKNSKHIPPDLTKVEEYMERLINWINQEDKLQLQLLRIAIAHHAFTWIHPFDNGNGRMSRILTYAMLRQYGFASAFILNPTAVFCINRNKYFDMLQEADSGTNEGKLAWCEYVLNGISTEMEKISKLADGNFFVEKIVQSSINRAFNFHFINEDYKKVLELVLRKDDILIKSKDIQEILQEKTTRQVTSLINKMVEAGLLQKISQNSRQYTINLLSKDLSRGILESLYAEGLINTNE